MKPRKRATPPALSVLVPLTRATAEELARETKGTYRVIRFLLTGKF